jgi:hypothetical protein
MVGAVARGAEKCVSNWQSAQSSGWTGRQLFCVWSSTWTCGAPPESAMILASATTASTGAAICTTAMAEIRILLTNERRRMLIEYIRALATERYGRRTSDTAAQESMTIPGMSPGFARRGLTRTKIIAPTGTVEPYAPRRTAGTAFKVPSTPIPSVP